MVAGWVVCLLLCRLQAKLKTQQIIIEESSAKRNITQDETNMAANANQWNFNKILKIVLHHNRACFSRNFIAWSY